MLFRLDSAGKEFSGRWLFRDISVQCNPGDKAGLIGRNGVGKTTLFDLIEGRIKPDSGQISRSRSLEISRLEQIPKLDPNRSVFEETLEVFEGLRRIEAELTELEHRIAEAGLNPEVSERYEECRTILALHGGYDYQARAEKVLFGLGFSREDLGMVCSRLSGGQRSRLALARTLLKPASLMLLDEPTNHLDLNGILWLTEFLQDVRFTLVVISHDRRFLDKVTTRTWEMESSTLYEYPAAYSASRSLRESRIRLEEEAYEKQQEWKRRTEDFIRRNIAGQKTRQAQSRRKRLQKEQWIEAPRDDATEIYIRIPEAQRGGNVAAAIEGGEVGYPGKCLLQDVNLRVSRGRRLGILGGNGSGKTTLLRTLLGDLPLLEGRISWGQHYLPGYFAQEGPVGAEGITVHDYLAGLNPLWTDERIRSFLALFGFRGEDVLKSVDCLSGGERSRLSLARLFSQPCNLLFLDEPTNHLDIDSREALEAALAEFGGSMVVVSHDLFFLENTVDELVLIRNRTIEPLDSLDQLREKLVPAEKPERAVLAPKLQPARKISSGISKNERMRLEQRMEGLEARIEALEKQRAQIEESLQSGTSDHSYLHQLSCSFQDVESQLSSLYLQWEELGKALELA